MTMDEMNELTTKFAVQEQKLEAILETTREIQAVVTTMQKDFNALKSTTAVQDERLLSQEKRLEHVELRVEKNSNELVRLEASTAAALKTSRWVSAAICTVLSLLIAAIGVFK